jgi:hypothetical protein
MGQRLPHLFFGVIFLIIPLFRGAAQETPGGRLEPPVVWAALNADGWVVLTAPEADSRVRVSAVVDLRGVPWYIPDIRRMDALPPSSYTAVVWSVDGGGAISEPLPVLLDFPPPQIENPQPGVWANRQRLVISGSENKEIFWSVDGGDPTGDGGRRYEGPVLIDQAGEITLQVAMRHADGRLLKTTVAYTVNEAKEEDTLAGVLKEIRAVEEKPVRAETLVPIPAPCFWSPGGVPRIPGGSPLVLRPAAGIQRWASLHIGGTGGTYRFVFDLDGTGGASPGQEPWNIPWGTYSLSETGAAGPRLVYAGSSRVLVWPRDRGPIRYFREGGAVWEDGSSPALIPPEGGIFRWVAGDSPLYGLRIEPVTALTSAASAADYSWGRYAYRSFAQGAEEPWRWTSPLMPYPERSALPVNDGEELEWIFITREGTVRGRWRSDRLAPPAPRLIAPPEGAWIRGPAALSIAGALSDPGLESGMAAQVSYSSGRTSLLLGRDAIVVPAPEEGIAEVRLEAWFADAAGNRSPLAVRNFTIDSGTIYVSALNRGAGPGSGSRDDPFRYLDEALDMARQEGIRSIRVAGVTQLRRPVRLSGDIFIDGDFDGTWVSSNIQARITISGEAAFRLEEGNVHLRSLSLERSAGEDYLFRVDAGGTLTLENVGLTLTGPFLRLGELGRGLFSGLRLSALMNRGPLISGVEANLEIQGSRFELEGEDGVLFDLRGGYLRGEDSFFRLKAQRTGTACILRETKTELTGVEVFAEAGDYACALDLRQAPALITRGNLEVLARDGVAVVSDDSEGIYLGTSFKVNSSFVARAVEIRARFPSVTDCRFTFDGSARQAEVFAGLFAKGTAGNIPLPEAGTIGGNVFAGFTHILGTAYPLESLAGFNRAFAPPGRPNTLAAAGGDR